MGGERAVAGDDDTDLTAAVGAAREGDEDAFRVLYREVQPGLLRYLRGLVGADADDVASEAWLQIARDIRTFRDQGTGFRGWAATIARNRALDHLRRHRRRPVTFVPVELLADVADEYDVADETLTAAATRSAVALIATLPRDQAEAILLRAVVGLDANAAAKVLGKRPGSVRTAAWRGLRRLAALLDQPPMPPPDRRTPADHGRLASADHGRLASADDGRLAPVGPGRRTPVDSDSGG